MMPALRGRAGFFFWSVSAASRHEVGASSVVVSGCTNAPPPRVTPGRSSAAQGVLVPVAWTPGVRAGDGELEEVVQELSCNVNAWVGRACRPEGDLTVRLDPMPAADSRSLVPSGGIAESHYHQYRNGDPGLAMTALEVVGHRFRAESSSRIVEAVDWPWSADEGRLCGRKIRPIGRAGNARGDLYVHGDTGDDLNFDLHSAATAPGCDGLHMHCHLVEDGPRTWLVCMPFARPMLSLSSSVYACLAGHGGARHRA